MHDPDQAAEAFWARRRVVFELDGAGGAVVINRETGYRWQRRPHKTAGQWWWQVSPARAGATRRTAGLLAHPDTTIGDVAASLRLALAEPWQTLLQRAEGLARDELGVSRGRIDHVGVNVRAVMEASELLPHRVLMVVDDPDALAASYRADAALAGGYVESFAFRHSARQQSEGPTVMTPPAPRGELVPELLRLFEDCRPGQRYVVEPVALAAAA